MNNIKNNSINKYWNNNNFNNLINNNKYIKIILNNNSFNKSRFRKYNLNL